MWQRAWITDHRLTTVEFGGLDMARVIVVVDPAGGESAIGDETGIIGAARGYDGHLYVLEDRSGSMGANDRGRTTCAGGSPPLAQGTLSLQPAGVPSVRLTPARAGNSG